MFIIFHLLACSEKDVPVNQSPEILSAAVVPAFVTTDTEMRCIGTAQDPDNDGLLLSYRWTIGDRTVGDSSVLTLSPDLVQPTDIITCVISVDDGQISVEESIVVEVNNTDPVVSNVIIRPEQIFVNSHLICEYDAEDVDLEFLNPSIQWRVGDTVLESGTAIELDPSQINKHQNLICEVTVEDGYGGVASAATSVTVRNSPPTLGAVQIAPESPTTQDIVRCVPTDLSDIDGDTIIVQYTWWLNGVEQAAQGSEMTGHSVGQTIECEATPMDGEAEGQSLRANSIVFNTPPQITEVEIQPSVGVKADGLLVCAASSIDVDNDALSTTYEWSTASTFLGAQALLQLNPSVVSVGEIVQCLATVTDVHGASVVQGTSVAVENTSPEFTTVPTIEGHPRSNETLTCSGEVEDLNDGVLSTTFSWSLGGVVMGTDSSLMIDPLFTNVGDEIVCVISAMDSDGVVISESTSVVIQNTIPQVAGVTMSNTSVYTDGVIEVLPTLNDDDLDQALSFLVEWHVLDVHGTDSIVQTGSTSVLDGQYFNKGDRVYALITPFDGLEYGIPLTSSFVDILNTPPSMPSMMVSPSTPHLGVDDIFCTVVNPSVDIDGDAVEYQFDWQDHEGQVIQTVQTAAVESVLSSSFVSVPQPIHCTVRPYDGDEYGSANNASVSPEFDCDCPQTTSRDFAFTYWPENFRHVNFNLYGFYTKRHFVTGYYGAVIDMSNGSLLNLSEVSNLTMEDAALSEDSWLLSSPSSDVAYSIMVNGTLYEAIEFLNSDENGSHGADNPSMLMDMGRFQQHIEIPEVLYHGNTDLLGSLSIVSSPQHLVLTHHMSSSIGYSGSISVQTTLSGDMWTQSQVVVLDGTRAVEVVDPDGVHWAVVAPEFSDNIVQQSDGSIVISRTVNSLNVGDELSISVLLLPMDQMNLEQLEMYLDPENTVQVSYAQMNQSDALTTPVQDAEWNWEHGAFQVPLGSMQGSGASHSSTNWSNGTDFNMYNRHQIEISHTSTNDLHVPLLLDGPRNTTFNITGGAPLFRNINKEPTGLAIQVSKNWHIPGYWPNWFHMYSIPAVPSGNHTMELTVAIGKWGETFAASHAQLSLVGWGTNQQWDESALGAWGESITYDPDKTLGRAMVDDVRPFLMNVNGQYNWTGNVGGADFLKYVDVSRPWREQQPTQLKTSYTAPGPVMTDVTYSGITTDDAIALTARTHLVRTDDMVRAYYVLQYEFLEDVDYARLGLFQIAADNYSDNGFTKYAYGDSSGVIFDGIVPNHNTTGYASNADRGIELTGEYPWVFMYDSTKTGGNLPEHVADVGFVVREYSAVINGAQIVHPHININRTNNGGWSQMAFELGVPFDASNTLVEAGSTIDAIIEYLVVPNDISLYYGPSTDMVNVDPTKFGTTDIIELLASSNTLEVTPSVGTLEQMQPTILNGVFDEIAVQFEMEGGFGYAPLTIQGLYRPDGWRLQYLDNGVWLDMDQSVHDNDYWQTRWDETSGTYALTFSVNIDVPTEFRLIQL